VAVYAVCGVHVMVWPYEVALGVGSYDEVSGHGQDAPYRLERRGYGERCVLPQG